MKTINENTNVNLDLKTIGLIVTMAISVSGTYFTLKADIEENNNKLERHNAERAASLHVKLLIIGRHALLLKNGGRNTYSEATAEGQT